jgi:hypothetical protein
MIDSIRPASVEAEAREIERLTELVGKANPAPWSVEEERADRIRLSWATGRYSWQSARDNAAFIAACREGVPFLLSALSARDEQITKLEERSAMLGEEWKNLLREARPFVHDAGTDEDPEASRRASDLLDRIDAMLSASPSISGEGEG